MDKFSPVQSGALYKQRVGNSTSYSWGYSEPDYKKIRDFSLLKI